MNINLKLNVPTLLERIWTVRLFDVDHKTRDESTSDGNSCQDKPAVQTHTNLNRERPGKKKVDARLVVAQALSALLGLRSSHWWEMSTDWLVPLYLAFGNLLLFFSASGHVHAEEA